MFNTSPNAVEVEKPQIIELTVQRKKYNIQEKINQVTGTSRSQCCRSLRKTVETPEILLQFTEVVVDTPCRGAETNPHRGPDCSDEHGDSTVALL